MKVSRNVSINGFESVAQQSENSFGSSLMSGRIFSMADNQQVSHRSCAVECRCETWTPLCRDYVSCKCKPEGAKFSQLRLRSNRTVSGESHTSTISCGLETLFDEEEQCVAGSFALH